MAGTGEGGMGEGETYQDLEGRGGMAPLSACPASGHSAGPQPDSRHLSSQDLLLSASPIPESVWVQLQEGPRLLQ